MISISEKLNAGNAKILPILTLVLVSLSIAFCQHFNLNQLSQDLNFRWQIFQQELSLNDEKSGALEKSYKETWLANYFFNDNDFESALKHYRAVLAAVSKLPGKLGQTTAFSEIQLRIGQCLYKLGRYEEAAPELAKAVAASGRPAFIICQDTDTLRMLRNSRGNSHTVVRI